MKGIHIRNTKVLNISKLSCWPAEVPRMRSTPFEFTEICRMTENDPLIEQEWSIHARSGVDS